MSKLIDYDQDIIHVYEDELESDDVSSEEEDESEDE